MMKLLQQSLMQESDFVSLLLLSGVALSVLVPLSLIRPSCVFMEGYGLSVATCAMVLMITLDKPLSLDSNRPELLLGLITTLYGLRLSLFLFFRGLTVPSIKKQTESFQKVSTSKLLVMAGLLSFLYASMTSPLLFVMKRPLIDGKTNAVTWVGIILSLFGALIESLADFHKYTVKRRHNITYGERNFVGPTTGLYAFCRHPNFSGEVLFWTGLFIAGLPSYEKSWTAWTSSLAGWMSLVGIMKSSSDRLDKKQDEWYHDQPCYMEWKKHVNSSMIPCIPLHPRKVASIS